MITGVIALVKERSMKGHRLLVAGWVVLFALGVIAAPASAQQNETLTEQGKTEHTIQDVLLAHPEVIVEALQRYQAQQDKATAEKQAQALIDRRDELTRAPDAPVLGNPNGDVTVVEFFDYRCPYCK